MDWESPRVLKTVSAALLGLAVVAAGWAWSVRSTLTEQEAELAASAAVTAAARRTADASAAQIKAREAELKAREAELRATVQKEIEGRDVEISRLKGQLSVRVLDRILFLSGSAAILPSGEKVLAKLAPALARGNELIRVEGHTDNMPIGEKLQPKYASNWELSTARAASVVRYFQQRGKIDAKRLEAVGFGEHRPVASNAKADTRQRNRRVEIVLTAREAAKAPAKPQP